jgi:dTDP-D-glucose 4,6-dehydratase
VSPVTQAISKQPLPVYDKPMGFESGLRETVQWYLDNQARPGRAR